MAEYGSVKEAGWYKDNRSGPFIISSKSLMKARKIDNLPINKHELNGLHSATRRVLLTGGMLGMFPLSGLSSAHSRHLRFTLFSPFALLYFASLAGQCFMFIMSIHFLLLNTISWTDIVTALNYTASFFTLIIMGNIGRTWPKFMKNVEKIEKTLPLIKKNIPLHCSVATVFMLLTGLVEQVLSISYIFTAANICNDIDIESYCYMNNPWIFDYIPYALWKGILIEIIGIHSVIIWAYNDLLIMVISIYLAEHFVVHNKLLKKATRKGISSFDMFQTQYSQIVRLVEMLSKLFGLCIVISFFNSFFWICMQLFYTLNKSQSGIYVSCNEKHMDSQTKVNDQELKHMIYFVYSFALIVVHLWLVLMLAAKVHSLSIKPLNLIYELPPYKFNIQVDRYIAQVKNIKVALSGLGVFYITRAMTLTILNTIVTIELVLLQYN